MHTKTELLELLRAGGIRLSKRLGQHYLIDPRICRRLVSLCEIAPEDTVVEIGAGMGALTDLLAERAKRVVAVEVDRAISEHLTRRLAHLSTVEVLCQDILEFPWARYPGSKVVGAIPYHITSPILVSLCEGVAPACNATSSAARTVPPRSVAAPACCDTSSAAWRVPPRSPAVAAAWLGIQHEVAQRLCAAPGSKAYGRLTVLVQYRFTVSRLARIARSAFFPQPEVDSAWVQLVAHPSPPVTVDDEALLFDVVRAAFSQRRKTLANCLLQLRAPRLTRSQALMLIQEAGLAAGVRGETLSLEAFARVTNHLRYRLLR